jgi:RNase P subunit RPR2
MKPHDIEVVIDEDVEEVIVRCKTCGKILWYPDPEEPCVPPLGVNVNDRISTKDRMG